ncbi:hypothetical protein BOX15_Mlig026013g1 [Macrostomum lignano]|uniref:RING-type domain-containing protein n=1 Tax=Macrostomum lignano TaxID=282301 RepID=A0A267DCU2_9PLAT|nr:hypothetical protein BOX15_Mlig026013g1 [Macrostomum lignano]
MSFSISSFVAKRRQLHQARTICQQSFGRKLRCAICGDKIRRWCQREETLCHPLSCYDHPCHSHCMLSILGADQPMGSQQVCPGAGCSRQFSQLCFHRSWWGRSSGQRSVNNLPSGDNDAVDGGDQLVDQTTDELHEAAAAAADGDSSSSSSGGFSLRNFRRFFPVLISSSKRQKRQQQEQEQRVSDEQAAEQEPMELSLNSLEAECAICCCGIDTEAGVPNGCCHSFCFDCLKEWVVNNASCPMDRRPVNFIYKRQPGSQAFTGRHRVFLRNSRDACQGGYCGPLESPPGEPHFSEPGGGGGGWFSSARLEPSAPPASSFDNNDRSNNANANASAARSGGDVSALFAFVAAVLLAIVIFAFFRRYGASPNPVPTPAPPPAAESGSSVANLIQFVVLVVVLYLTAQLCLTSSQTNTRAVPGRA